MAKKNKDVRLTEWLDAEDVFAEEVKANINKDFKDVAYIKYNDENNKIAVYVTSTYYEFCMKEVHRKSRTVDSKEMNKRLVNSKNPKTRALLKGILI